ncbi:MAG: hypothetical protein ACE5GY_06905 [Thermodesulfobacteriota bacterium]
MSTEKKFWIITVVVAALFAYGVFNIFKPDIPPLSFVRGTVREIAPGVLVGPYPSENEMYRLKAMGVRTVISLMDPDSRVESMIVAKGRARAEGYGMEYYAFPMTVMDMEGEGNIRMVKEAVRQALSSSGKKVYVHCYLGRHRVGIFEREFLKAKMARDDARPGLPAPEAGAVP